MLLKFHRRQTNLAVSSIEAGIFPEPRVCANRLRANPPTLAALRALRWRKNARCHGSASRLYAAKIANKVQNRSDEQLLEELRAFVRKNGRVSTRFMVPANGLASHMVYRKRFCSFKKLYDLVPYRLTQTFVPQCEAKRSINLRADIQNQFIDELSEAGLSFAMSGHLFTLFGQGMLSLEVGRCVRTEYRGSLRWQINSRPNTHEHPRLMVRLDSDNRVVLDCCLFAKVPSVKVRFLLSDEVARRSATIQPTTARVAEFIAAREPNWLESWAAAAAERAVG